LQGKTLDCYSSTHTGSTSNKLEPTSEFLLLATNTFTPCFNHLNDLSGGSTSLLFSMASPFASSFASAAAGNNREEAGSKGGSLRGDSGGSGGDW
jgi:hypothetical protein